ncbi:splicing regulator SDE2 [Syngnathus scovelli]|uniref:splicing regulator SDE2 n=1 Tax=Syngnathus scovelli TaxID=161590 RepID=UPI00210F798C|nr:splicing regulator SDE2 [Syngnathus scovelli]
MDGWDVLKGERWSISDPVQMVAVKGPKLLADRLKETEEEDGNEEEAETEARLTPSDVNMETSTEVFVCGPGRLRFSPCVFPQGSSVGDVLERFVQQWAPSSPLDFYVSRDGRVTRPDERLRGGAVYRLVPRLPGGKGGFGSMLRALGAQIEKTTNREACRDLSGRRLRDVNHEKEMGEWLKQQAEREAEKERQRAERLQRKTAEPAHQFSDPAYQRQCHSLAERLEDSVLKGLQATASKRAGPAHDHRPTKKKKTAACFWTGLDDLSSEEAEEEHVESTDEEGAEPATTGEGTREVVETAPPEGKRGMTAKSSPGPQHAQAGDALGEAVASV